MSDEEPRSLTDDQIKADYRTDPNFLPAIMREVEALDDKLAGDDDDITISKESLRTIQMGMRALAKTQSEMVMMNVKMKTAESGLFGDSDHGDRGANCDYNPFNRVNTGDWF